MREIPSIRAGAAAAMAQFHSHLTPPSAAAAPPPAAPASCEPRRCPWWPYTNAKEFKANTTIILVAFICALIFALAFNAAVRYLLHRQCERDLRQDDQKAETEGGGEEPEVPALIFTEETMLPGGETECVICLSDFAAGEKIRVLDRCNHGFHLECVQRWLNFRSSCPTCRTDCSTP